MLFLLNVGGCVLMSKCTVVVKDSQGDDLVHAICHTIVTPTKGIHYFNYPENMCAHVLCTCASVCYYNFMLIAMK